MFVVPESFPLGLSRWWPASSSTVPDGSTAPVGPPTPRPGLLTSTPSRLLPWPLLPSPEVVSPDEVPPSVLALPPPVPSIALPPEPDPLVLPVVPEVVVDPPALPEAVAEPPALPEVVAEPPSVDPLLPSLQGSPDHPP